jgi:glucose-6-phosphate 1-epimerase
VKNTGDSEFEFQALQHTYHALKDARGCSVSGLGGSSFVDKLKGPELSELEPGDSVEICEEVDRIFLHNGSSDVVASGASVDGRDVRVRYTAEKDGTGAQCEVVVWNPWVDKSAKLADFPDDGYRSMLCIEPGRVWGREALAPSSSFSLVQEVSYE